MFFILSPLSGLLATLALPPVNQGWAGLLGLGVLYALLQNNASIKKSFALGWLWAFGYFTGGLYWISWALTHDMEKFGWLIPFAVLGLPAALAVYGGLAAAAFAHLRQKNWGGPFTFSLLLLATEWLRGHLFTGFPWNMFGMFWGGVPGIAQSASVVGLYGLTFLTIITAAVGAEAMRNSQRHKQVAMVGCVMVFWGVVWMVGEARLHASQTSDASHAPQPSAPLIRIVQPSISPTDKWDAAKRVENFQKLMALSAPRAGDTAAPHIILWPETALDYRLAQSDIYRQQLSALLSPGRYVLTGVIRRNTATGQSFNSMVAYDHDGQVVGHYDKHHLVPFGEFVPFRSFAPVATLAAGVGDFSHGRGPTTWALPHLPAFSPLICYEVIFSGRATTLPRPDFLLNITNDSWYEKTSGPHQHAAMARWRAIEEGLPLVRAANTGLSMVVDAYGRTLEQLDLYEVGRIDARLPPALPPTLFATWRHGPLMLLLLAAAAGAWVWRRFHHEIKNP